MHLLLLNSSLFDLIRIKRWNSLHFLLLKAFEAQKVLLSMASDLAASPGANIFLNQAPIFTIKLKTLKETLVLSFSPTAVELHLRCWHLTLSRCARWIHPIQDRLVLWGFSKLPRQGWALFEAFSAVVFIKLNDLLLVVSQISISKSKRTLKSCFRSGLEVTGGDLLKIRVEQLGSWNSDWIQLNLLINLS